MGRAASTRDWITELGFERTERLTQDLCEQRARRLKRGLRHGYWDEDEELYEHAKFYRRWFEWKAKQFGDSKQ